MQQYLDLLSRVLHDGVPKADRTGTGTRSVFGHQMRFDLGQGFPLVTTKKLYLRAIVHELLWFLAGDTNVAYLRDNKVTIWDEWADEEGDLGPVYGKQWRSWACPDGRTIDQIAWVQEEIRKNPILRGCRRQRLEPGRPRGDGARALPLPVPVPCRGSGRAAAAVVPALPAVGGRVSRRAVQHRELCAADRDDGADDRLRAGDFVHSFGDAHLYDNHLGQARLQLMRAPARAAETAAQPGDPRPCSTSAMRTSRSRAMRRPTRSRPT